jgi:hypothetical protein
VAEINPMYTNKSTKNHWNIKLVLWKDKNILLVNILTKKEGEDPN